MTLSTSKRRKLDRLIRRRSYLNGLPENEGSDASRDWDRAEIAALDFAIETIESHYGVGGADD